MAEQQNQDELALRVALNSAADFSDAIVYMADAILNSGPDYQSGAFAEGIKALAEKIHAAVDPAADALAKAENNTTPSSEARSDIIGAAREAHARATDGVQFADAAVVALAGLREHVDVIDRSDVLASFMGVEACIAKMTAALSAAEGALDYELARLDGWTDGGNRG
jgi:hypothetical protein